MVKRKLPAQASCFERRRKLRCGQLSKRAENPTAKSTGLLDLPRELRDMIYDYALVSAHSVSVLNLTVDFRHHLPKQRLGMTPSLLVASKFVYAEALGVLYGNNVFQAELYLEVQQAQRWHEITHAMRFLNLPPDFTPPEPDVVCLTDRPQYSHPRLRSIRRLEVILSTVFPKRPHWQQQPRQIRSRIDYRFMDICRALIGIRTQRTFSRL